MSKDEKDRKDFERHVSLIQFATGAKLSDARFEAWLQGPKGLEALDEKVSQILSTNINEEISK